tara:strand:+ start:1073 stop:1276 length:204 start_codon:yes stop_codon:yes gene_type:complete
MSRSRALNRFNRFTAKKRRRALRSEVPSLRGEEFCMNRQIDHSESLKDEALLKEVSMDLLETELTLN